MRIKLNLTVAQFAAVQVVAVTVLLILGAATYAFMHLTGHDYVLGFLRLFDVGKERSVPTFFSSLNLLFAFVLLLIIYRYEKASGSKAVNYWLFLTLLFLYLSVDEAAAIHENFSRVGKALAARGLVPVTPYHEWVPYAVVFVIVVAIILLPFVRRLPRDTARLFVAAALVFVVGAVGFEALGTWMLASGLVESSREPIYQARRLTEEGLEMFGIVIFNTALYREILKRDISIIINADLPDETESSRSGD